jgi:glycosyltransferase involved in cell wall biosynthesis
VSPVLFVTNHVPPDRRGAFAALHARVPIELALFGGRSHHATASVADPGVPHRHVAQRELFGLAASGAWSAVVCGTAGRLALPASYAGARRAGTSFVLWSALWAQPRSPAHLAGAALLRRIYADADAVAAYGPHVAAHARRRGARRVVTAPQAVDQAFWTEPVAAPPRTGTRFLFVGRPAPGKGLPALLEAWRAGGLGSEDAELVLVGDQPALEPGDAVVAHAAADPVALRNFYAAADVLVVPSVPTPTFREPWGLVCNEAMHQGLPIIATDAVGAAAGGLVRHERNGLVVPAGDPDALGAAMRRLHEEPALRRRMGTQGRRDAAAFSFDAWADGMAAALQHDTSWRT